MQVFTDSAVMLNGQKHYMQWWLPEGEVRAVIQIAHGYAEHIARYQTTAEYLTNLGVAVYGIDYPGHGKSEGLSVYLNDFGDLVRLHELILEKVKDNHPDLPVFILGHSMGSLVALRFGLKYQTELAGLIISASALEGHKTAPPLIVKLIGVLNMFIPKFRVAREIQPQYLSHDEAVVEAYRNDPLIDLGKWRIRTGYEVAQSIYMMREKVSDIQLPLLIMHGGADKELPISGAHYLYDNAQSTDKTIKIYEDMYHEVLNEVKRAETLADMQTWLDAHIP